MSGKPISTAEVLAKLIGDHRSPEIIAADGAKLVLKQIARVRAALILVEAEAQEIVARKGHQADKPLIEAWRELFDTSADLLDGMIE